MIVDDAHVDPDRLVRLAQLRRDLSASFSIVASVWPGARDAVADRLGLTSSQVRELDLLTRDQIVEVIRASGLAGPAELIREIVDQAGGRPGLAVTLVSLCRGGGVRDVALGTALKRSVHSFLKKLIGESAVQILAAFAVGGDPGVSWIGVSRAFGLSTMDLQRIVAGLEASGVITDVDENYLAVQPATLRYALVRDLFFLGSVRLDYRPLMEASRNLRGVAETLVGVQAVGGQVPPALLWDVLETAGSASAWVHFAWLGRDEATRVLNEKPELLSQVTAAALHRVPEAAIGKLLDRSVADLRNVDSHPDQPLRQVRDWIAEARPGTGDGLERREILLRSAATWIAQGGNEVVGMSAFATAFSPQCSWTDCDPGSGRTITLSSCYLTPAELVRLEDIWGKWLDSFQSSVERGWKPVLDLLREWVYPDLGLVKSGQRDDEVRNALQRMAGRMLKDIAPLVGERPGIQQKLAQYAEKMRVVIPTRRDADYEILFPGRDALRGDWQEGEVRQLSAATHLAEEWSARDPVWVARRIADLTREAVSVQNIWPDHSSTVCRLIAEATNRPIEWIRAMENADVSGLHVGPFLGRMIALDDPLWISIARGFLERPSWTGIIVELVLTNPSPRTDLLDLVLAKLSGCHADHIMTLTLRREIPEKTVRRLLRHDDPAVAFSAGVGGVVVRTEGLCPRVVAGRMAKGGPRRLLRPT